MTQESGDVNEERLAGHLSDVTMTAAKHAIETKIADIHEVTSAIMAEEYDIDRVRQLMRTRGSLVGELRTQKADWVVARARSRDPDLPETFEEVRREVARLRLGLHGWQSIDWQVEVGVLGWLVMSAFVASSGWRGTPLAYAAVAVLAGALAVALSALCTIRRHRQYRAALARLEPVESAAEVAFDAVLEWVPWADDRG